MEDEGDCPKVVPTEERNTVSSVYAVGPKEKSQGDWVDFYEGRFVYTRRDEKQGIAALLKRLYMVVSIDGHEYRFFEHCLKDMIQRIDLRILDVGCGGGNQQLLRYGQVTGVDLSFQSLVAAREAGYQDVCRSDLLQLPFPTSTFDVVTSTHVLGHIPLNIKQSVIQEIYRVTKPGGFSMHSVECDSNAWFYRRAKQFPDLYQKYFVEMYGHYGLELPKVNFGRFRRAGFRPIFEEADPRKGYIRPIESYAVFFDNDLKHVAKEFWLLAFLSRLFSANRVVRKSVNLLFGMFVPMSNWLTPPDHRDSLKCVYQKTTSID